MFEPYLRRWNLLPDGDPIVTRGSYLLPVRMDGHINGNPAMLKIVMDTEEKFGGLVMQWWNGDGAARVYAYEGDALLMERAQGANSLMQMACNGQDDEASRIACNVIAKLHQPRSMPPPELIPLNIWFEALESAAQREGGVLLESLAAARELLASPHDIVVLHGDIHHENVLDFGSRGWLAIDPKRIIGERGYDYANLLCNPELPSVTDPIRFIRQSYVIAQAANLERRRLLQWTLAYAGLSASWFLEDDDRQNADSDFSIAELALQALSTEANNHDDLH
ncbi:MAG: 3'-kinase [Nitrosomonas sp.]|uniref:aminoglycoside phosphotransferase family protein n=1 Tax=Nitrosomonas sp. TaxID=42353 RepID=UPI000D4B0603|nr:3'-kinase [Bacteroidota bacterium]QOJ21462.1 MAG: 3'-kinase [Gammaproteobacteria bacterium]TXI40407.1 MAG: 3'-kinase [Nitrosomonas sp.]HNH52843.1 aminoglycoside phosphotransferase family protein [Nitrosomonas sp.]